LSHTLAQMRRDRTEGLKGDVRLVREGTASAAQTKENEGSRGGGERARLHRENYFDHNSKERPIGKPGGEGSGSRRQIDSWEAFRIFTIAKTNDRRGGTKPDVCRLSGALYCSKRLEKANEGGVHKQKETKEVTTVIIHEPTSREPSPRISHCPLTQREKTKKKRFEKKKEEGGGP